MTAFLPYSKVFYSENIFFICLSNCSPHFIQQRLQLRLSNVFHKIKHNLLSYTIIFDPTVCGMLVHFLICKVHIFIKLCSSEENSNYLHLNAYMNAWQFILFQWWQMTISDSKTLQYHIKSEIFHENIIFLCIISRGFGSIIYEFDSFFNRKYWKVLLYKELRENTYFNWRYI